jgi:hypothetical protein
MNIFDRTALYSVLAAVTLASGCIVAPERHDSRRDERAEEHARAEQHAEDRREEHRDDRHDDHRCDGPDRDHDDHCH